jgi:fatty acid CoA ligase FadD9
VNHMLAYEHLFAPNVAGTAELVRLALSTRQKRFDFVSSAAVTLLVDTARGNDEDSPLVPSIPLSDAYAAGYGASKWAAEALLQSAHRRFGLPVNVFRGDMMMPHTRYRGQINVPDMITRLLYSIIMTGLAPLSFYELAADGSRARAHYDGLPVDFIADTMVGIGAAGREELRTFNVCNYHDDGVSLDTMVDWIESAGYPIERVRDHAEWARRFAGKLATLTEAQRQHSSLAIVGYFDKPHPAHESAAGSRHFAAAVRELSSTVPHLSEAYIHKYLDDMHRLGLIAAPKQARVADVA